MLPSIAGLGAFLGHLFPVWLRFKGGKGVATYIGLLIGLAWPGALDVLAVWLACRARLSRFSSLRRCSRSALTRALAARVEGAPNARARCSSFLLTVLLWIMHRANIARLLNGNEGKIGARD